MCSRSAASAKVSRFWTSPAAQASSAWPSWRRAPRSGSERKGIKVLDIAGGSSIFGMTILARDPSAQVTQLDWPNVNAVAKKLNRERGLDGKIRFIDGEHHSATIEANHYDLV